MHTGTCKHTTFKENHRLRSFSQAKKSNLFAHSRSSRCRVCLLGRDVQPHGLCPDLLPLPFLPLQASRLQVATQQREKGADERPFFSLSCHSFNCPELNQILVSHMDEREREHAEHNPATVSSHLLPASSYPVPGLWQWLLML